MQARVTSLSRHGLQVSPVTVEVDISHGLPQFQLVGLASSSIQEAKQRVRSAIRNSGFRFPSTRIVANLAPADRRKYGSHFDLPIAMAILAASEQIARPEPSIAYCGELSLTGQIIPVDQPYSLIYPLDETAIKTLIMAIGGPIVLPAESNISLREINCLRELKQSALGRTVTVDRRDTCATARPAAPLNIVGQSAALRALEISLAGGHHCLLVGPPGVGKSMIASAADYLLPPPTQAVLPLLTLQHEMDAEAIDRPIWRPAKQVKPPFTLAKLYGSRRPFHPGQLLLAGGGALILDELPNYSTEFLQSLPPALDGRPNDEIRSQLNIYPYVSPIILATANPCRCGYYQSLQSCRCSPYVRQSYRRRLTGPLIDRFNLMTFLSTEQASRAELSRPDFQQFATRIEIARHRQARRYGHDETLNSHHYTVSRLESSEADGEVCELLDQIIARYHLSSRQRDSILAVSRTIADLDESDMIKTKHLTEASNYRVDWEP